MEYFESIVVAAIPNFDFSDSNLPFSKAGIESIDLITLRVAFENHIHTTIPDEIWLNFETVTDIIDYCRQNNSKYNNPQKLLFPNHLEKDITINMPQMAIEGLSENWLFKELGSMHWELLCHGLMTISYDLKDELGNRLYATFVRISIDSHAPLNAFKENEHLTINTCINRFGNSLYYSTSEIKAESAVIQAKMMTSFSIRNENNNNNLSKSQPSEKTNLIELLSENPSFGNEYRALKKRELEALNTTFGTFKITDKVIFEYNYTINPYYDLNGVGLLYFASYPIINNIGEAAYGNQTDERWEENYFTLARDIFYFANCNIHEEIVYKLHDIEYLADNTIKTNSSLYRKSDAVLMAKIFTLKRKKS